MSEPSDNKGNRGRGDKNYVVTHRQFLYPTTDDWYPNRIRNTVMVRVSEIYISKRLQLLISIWGDDDYGLEKRVDVSQEELKQVLDNFLHFVDYQLPNPITVDWLLQMGFETA